MGFTHRSLFVLMMVALIGGCREQQPPHVVDPKTNNGEGPPELTMEILKIQSYGLPGLEWEMTAPRADGYTTKSKMHAEEIKIRFFQNGKKSTDVTAKQGVLRFDTHTQTIPQGSSFTIPAIREEKMTGPEKLDTGDMYLSGDVVAVSTDGSKMLTDWILFDKSQNLIYSTAPVKIIREDSITDGIGLEATSNLSSVKIFHQTSTIKEKPKPRKK